MKKTAVKAKRKTAPRRPVTRVIRVLRRKPTSRPRLRRKDRVKWENTNTKRLEIVFSARWPFQGRRRNIPVAAGKRSATLTVSPAAKGRYRYAIKTKEVFTNDKRREAPDPPGFSVGG